mmetsp:Transcript_1986/g.7661  ORF Transcript_1986/g.7661 Transcript_1986/m.7661 type:complete len:388 (-) Transcript_1986:280-1443(-)
MRPRRRERRIIMAPFDRDAPQVLAPRKRVALEIKVRVPRARGADERSRLLGEAPPRRRTRALALELGLRLEPRDHVRGEPRDSFVAAALVLRQGRSRRVPGSAELVAPCGRHAVHQSDVVFFGEQPPRERLPASVRLERHVAARARGRSRRRIEHVGEFGAKARPQSPPRRAVLARLDSRAFDACFWWWCTRRRDTRLERQERVVGDCDAAGHRGGLLLIRCCHREQEFAVATNLRHGVHRRRARQLGVPHRPPIVVAFPHEEVRDAVDEVVRERRLINHVAASPRVRLAQRVQSRRGRAAAREVRHGVTRPPKRREARGLPVAALRREHREQWVGRVALGAPRMPRVRVLERVHPRSERRPRPLEHVRRRPLSRAGCLDRGLSSQQ